MFANRIGWRETFLTQVLIVIIISALPICAQLVPVDLNDWVQEGLPGNGNWQVAADGSSVLQTINGAPTFFVGPDTLINTLIQGSLEVETTGDNDFIGFVFGYQRPDSAESFFDFYLLDWKQGTQTFSTWTAEEGYTLSRVQGEVTGSLASGNVPYWNHSDSAFTVIDTRYGDDQGWLDNTEYEFQLLYESNRIQITIDTTVIFDTTGTFPAGRFGFYNYSQSTVRYRGFSRNQFPVAVNDTAMTLQDSSVVIDVLSNDFDPEGQPITIDSVSGGSNGFAVIDSAGQTIEYFPDSLFAGIDTLNYYISDSLGGTASAMVLITVNIPVGVSAADVPITDFNLAQNYPNPFNPTTRIRYTLGQAANVQLTVFSQLGQHVQTLINGRMMAGPHSVDWDGRDAKGFSVASGIYFYRLKVGNRFMTRKMTLLR